MEVLPFSSLDSHDIRAVLVGDVLSSDEIGKMKDKWSYLPTDIQELIRDFDGYYKEVWSRVLAELKPTLPLPFFSSGDTGLALPMVFIPYGEMRIRFQFPPPEESRQTKMTKAMMAGWSRLPYSIQDCIREFDGYYKELWGQVMSQLTEITLKNNKMGDIRRILPLSYGHYLVSRSKGPLSITYSVRV